MREISKELLARFDCVLSDYNNTIVSPLFLLRKVKLERAIECAIEEMETDLYETKKNENE